MVPLTNYIPRLIFTLVRFLCLSLTVNLCVVGKSSARPIVIDEKEQRVSVGPFLRYLEDARHQLKIKDVIDPHFEKKWLSNSSPALNFGFSESTYWLHLQLENVTSSTRERILALEYPPMDMMETYTFEASGSEQLLGRCGDTIPFKERPIKSRYCTVSLQIPPQSTLNVILKLHTEGSFQIPLMLYTPSAYYSHDHEQQLFFGALIAILAVMALYNFFIFLSLKEATYFYYVIYITGEILFYGCTNGIAYEYFWPSLSGWSRVSLPATLGLSVISGIPFTLSYLRTRDHVPRIDLALKAVIPYFTRHIRKLNHRPMTFLLKKDASTCKPRVVQISV